MSAEIQVLARMTMDANMATTKLGNVGRALPDLKKIDRARKDIQRLNSAISNWDRAFKRNERELRRVQQGLGRALPRLETLKRNTEKTSRIAEAARKSAKVGENLKKLLDKTIFRRVTPPKAGILLNGLSGIATAGFIAIGAKTAETVQQYDLNRQRIVDNDLNRNLTLTLRQKTRIDRLEKTTTKNSQDLDRLAKAVGDIRVYVNRQLTNFQIRLDQVRKQANDALYETRAGRKIVEAQVRAADKKANDALYETRAGRKVVEAQVRAADKKANDALYETRAGRKIVEAQVRAADKKANDALYETRAGRQIVETRVTRVENRVTNLEKGGSPGQLPGNIMNAINKASSDASKALSQVANVPAIAKKEVDARVSQFNNQLNNKLDKSQFVDELGKNSNQIIRVVMPAVQPVIQQAIKPYEIAFPVIQGALKNLGNQVGEIVKKDSQQDKELTKNNWDIENLKIRVKWLEDMDSQANRKLDELLKWSLTIPPALALIPRKTTDLVLKELPQKLPNNNDIGKAVRDNTPRSLCRFDPTPINSHTSALDVVQTALIADVRNTTGIVNAKLGPQLPGGVSGFLQSFLARFNQVAQWLHLDRILNVMIWWQTLHNAAMLSNNIVVTLAQGLTNVLTFIGIKDAEGNALDVGQVVGKAYTDMLKSALGEETYNNLSKAWNAANRIYQSAANIVFAIQSIQQAILSALEVIGAGVARIANALKAAGQVFENAYAWMNPQPNFDNALFRFLNRVQETASNIELVTQTPLTIKDSVTQIGQERQNIATAMADGENALKGLGVIPSETETKKAQESKQASAGKDLDAVDKLEAS